VRATQARDGFAQCRDLFEKAGIKGEPKTWDEFLDACKKLNESGVAPIAVGARDSWTLAAWFDYFDLRINGYAFHAAANKSPFCSRRVRVLARESGTGNARYACRNIPGTAQSRRGSRKCQRGRYRMVLN